MPVEIRELQINAVVQDHNASSSSSPQPAASSDANNIIAQCVEQVLEILKQKNER